MPTVYVLKAGTRAEKLALAKKFEETSAASQRADFVTKDNEPGDLGIQGVSVDPTVANAVLPLDAFRNSVLRTVSKKTSAKAGGKATYALSFIFAASSVILTDVTYLFPRTGQIYHDHERKEVERCE